MPTTFGMVTGGGGLHTARVTLLPLSTTVFATGFWLRTSPLLAVSHLLVVVVVAARPSTCRVAAALCSLSPTTLGTITVTGGGGDGLHRLRVTLVSLSTTVLADGLWLTTSPLSTLSHLLVVVVVAARPSTCRVVAALCSLSPTTLGTITVTGGGGGGD